MESFYVYIIESAVTGQWYYGFTQRLDERMQEYNSNNKHFTGGKGPWQLIFKRRFSNQPDALKFERLLKKLKNKKFLQTAYAEYFT